jgi:hypothetical protein
LRYVYEHSMYKTFVLHLCGIFILIMTAEDKSLWLQIGISR